MYIGSEINKIVWKDNFPQNILTPDECKKIKNEGITLT